MFNVNFRPLKPIYVHLLVCYLNKLQNDQCNDKDGGCTLTETSVLVSHTTHPDMLTLGYMDFFFLSGFIDNNLFFRIHAGMFVEYDIMVIYPRDISHCCFNCRRLCSDSGTMITVVNMKITSVRDNLASFLSWPLCSPLFCHNKQENSPCFEFSNPFLHFVIGAEVSKIDVTSNRHVCYGQCNVAMLW